MNQKNKQFLKGAAMVAFLMCCALGSEAQAKKTNVRKTSTVEANISTQVSNVAPAVQERRTKSQLQSYLVELETELTQLTPNSGSYQKISKVIALTKQEILESK